ncbi:MAG: hypothetical protein ACR2QC_11530 [Gammaproteobacteria bacterium]
MGVYPIKNLAKMTGDGNINIPRRKRKCYHPAGRTKRLHLRLLGVRRRIDSRRRKKHGGQNNKPPDNAGRRVSIFLPPPPP